MSSDEDPAQWIVPTRGAKTLPAVEILTGRGFITGKSGSGKSNTASVIAEELLDNNYNLLIVDTEGEYYGLKAEYELLHVGNDEKRCDVTVTPDHAEKIASVAIEENVPVVLDVSDFLDGDLAQELIASVVRELYRKEKEARKPFLLMIEELQEYLPQTGGSSELAELLERVAKRGRKRGLGMLGMSQRPSSVDKDFITQCDWMVWHRLTWKNDIDVVRNILGTEIADEIEDLDTGEAYLMTDWDDGVDRVTFKRKRTHDAGATPGLESYERPDLKSVSSDLITGFSEDSVAENDDVGQQTGDSAPATSDDSTPSASLDIEADPSELDRTELVELANTLRERNHALEAEVDELRAMLRDAEQQSSRDSNDDPLTSPARAATHPDTEPGHQASSTPTRARPQPPTRPATRTGVSGTLIEFTAMLLYLVRAFFYRLKLVLYRLGTSSSNDRER